MLARGIGCADQEAALRTSRLDLVSLEQRASREIRVPEKMGRPGLAEQSDRDTARFGALDRAEEAETRVVQPLQIVVWQVTDERARYARQVEQCSERSPSKPTA